MFPRRIWVHYEPGYVVTRNGPVWSHGGWSSEELTADDRERRANFLRGVRVRKLRRLGWQARKALRSVGRL